VNIAGHKIPSWALWGGGIGAGLVAVIYLRSRGAGSPASAQSGNDPLTGLPYSQDNQTDPQTGLPYLTEAQEYGSVAAADAAAGTAASSGYATSGGGGYVGSAGYPTSTAAGSPSATQAYATNAAWSQAVTAGLASLGYTPTDVSAALGLYFADAPLSAVQASIVQAAIAEFGPAPQGTYSIIAAPSSGGAVGSGTGGTPTPSGGSYSSGGSSSAAASAPTGAPGSVTAGPSGKTTNLNVSWTTVAGATKYETDITKLDSGLIHDGVTGPGPITVDYVGQVAAQGWVKVRAGNSAGWGPWSASKQWSFK